MVGVTLIPNKCFPRKSSSLIADRSTYLKFAQKYAIAGPNIFGIFAPIESRIWLHTAKQMGDRLESDMGAMLSTCYIATMTTMPLSLPQRVRLIHFLHTFAKPSAPIPLRIAQEGL